MCSLPTMKFKPAAAPGWAGLACATGAGVGLAPFSRGGPLSFSLCTYNVRMMKNCPVEAVISFKAFRAAPGAALKLISTMLRSINGVASVAPGFADLAFQLFFKIIQRSAVTIEITLQFPIISLVRKRIELPEPVPLCCHLVECLSCIRPNTPSPVEKYADKQRANGKANHQGAECPI